MYPSVYFLNIDCFESVMFLNDGDWQGWIKLHTEMCIVLGQFNMTNSAVSVVLCSLDVRICNMQIK